MLRIILLGLGVQSTALYYMSSTGQLPRADYAIFADPGKEAAGTYQYLDFLLQWQRDHSGIPIHVCKEKNIYEDLLSAEDSRRFVTVPAFTLNPDGSTGMLRRQCTYEYKIRMINDYIRDHIYMLPKGARRPTTAVWMGITTDEIERMAYPKEAWHINTYPFLNYYTTVKSELARMDWGKNMSRQDVIRWYTLHELPVPPKSACVFCPYQSDQSWAVKKATQPEDFAAAVQVDEAIRNSTARGIHHPVYLHRSCKPLREIEFNSAETKEWGECSGHCHT